ncbi:MAG: hypothetical protein QOE53_812 [Pseudonocardiales bacterium]|nr:hypothetical protein [Pseudonocardiales bacterium]
MASTPIAESITADHDADVVVFLIGMRINRWRSIRYWGPVLLAFLPMLRELLREPSSGCRSARTFLSGRTILTVQYWDTVEQVLAYAHDPQGRHRPAWRAFNRTAARTTAVGIFHETYSVKSGNYESIYRAMPPFGLAAATGSVAPVARRGTTARDRLAAGGRAAGSSAVLAHPVLPHPLLDAQRGFDHLHDLGLDLPAQERDVDLDLAGHQLGGALGRR